MPGRKQLTQAKAAADEAAQAIIEAVTELVATVEALDLPLDDRDVDNVERAVELMSDRIFRRNRQVYELLQEL